MGHVLLALIIAMLISGRSYSIAMDPLIVDASAANPPLNQAAFAAPIASALLPTSLPATPPPPLPTGTHPSAPIEGLPTATSYFETPTLLPPATATPRAGPKALPISPQSPATSQPIVLYTAQSGYSPGHFSPFRRKTRRKSVPLTRSPQRPSSPRDSSSLFRAA